MPSRGAVLDDARNRTALSPSYKEGGVGVLAPPTGIPQYGGGEEQIEEDGDTQGGTDYGYGALDDSADAYEEEDESLEDEPEEMEDEDSDEENARGIIQAAGAQALASSATKKLDPMDNVKFVTLDWWIWILFTPKGWASYLKVDSYINPTETTIRLTILKVSFWTVVVLGIVFLAVVIVVATAEINPVFQIMKFWAGVFFD